MIVKLIENTGLIEGEHFVRQSSMKKTPTFMATGDAVQKCVIYQFYHPDEFAEFIIH